MKIKEILDIDIKKSHLKKIGAALIAGVMIAGGGLCLAHEYNDCYKDQERTAYIQSQASAQGITLIDEAAVKNIVAKTIGVEESNIEFHKIKLKNYQGKYSTEFKPVYKVKCFANGVKYELRIDAVSGEILNDKDHFHHDEGRIQHNDPQHNQNAN